MIAQKGIKKTVELNKREKPKRRENKILLETII
jgi:hypothetical protein